MPGAASKAPGGGYEAAGADVRRVATPERRSAPNPTLVAAATSCRYLLRQQQQAGRWRCMGELLSEGCCTCFGVPTIGGCRLHTCAAALRSPPPYGAVCLSVLPLLAAAAAASKQGASAARPCTGAVISAVCCRCCGLSYGWWLSAPHPRRGFALASPLPPYLAICRSVSAVLPALCFSLD
jgi:hypothetical protein